MMNQNPTLGDLNASREVVEERLERITKLQRRWHGWVESPDPLPAKDVDVKKVEKTNVEYIRRKASNDQRRYIHSTTQMMVQMARDMAGPGSKKSKTLVGAQGNDNSSGTAQQRPASAAAVLRGKSSGLHRGRPRPSTAEPRVRIIVDGDVSTASGNAPISHNPMDSSEVVARGSRSPSPGIDSTPPRTSSSPIVRGDSPSSVLDSTLQSVLRPGEDAPNLSSTTAASEHIKTPVPDASSWFKSSAHDPKRSQHQTLNGFGLDEMALLNAILKHTEEVVALDPVAHSAPGKQKFDGKTPFWHHVLPNLFAAFEATVYATKDHPILGPLLLLLFDGCKRAAFLDAPPLLMDNTLDPVEVVGDAMREARATELAANVQTPGRGNASVVASPSDVADQGASQWINARVSEVWGSLVSHTKAASVAIHPLIKTETAAMDKSILTGLHERSTDDPMEMTYAQRRKLLRKLFIAWRRVGGRQRAQRAWGDRHGALLEHGRLVLAFSAWRATAFQGISGRRTEAFTMAQMQLNRERDRLRDTHSETHHVRHLLNVAQLEAQSLRSEVSDLTRQLRDLDSPMVFDFRQPVKAFKADRPIKEGTVHFRINTSPDEKDWTAQQNSKGFFDLSFVHAEEGVAKPGKEKAFSYYLVKFDANPEKPKKEELDANDIYGIEWVNRAVTHFCEENLTRRGKATNFGWARLQREYDTYLRECDQANRVWRGTSRELKLIRSRNTALLMDRPTPRTSIAAFGTLAGRPDLYLAVLTSAVGQQLTPHIPQDKDGTMRETANFVAEMMERLGLLQRVDVRRDGFPVLETTPLEGEADAMDEISPEVSPRPGHAPPIQEATHRLIVSRIRSFVAMARGAEKFGTAVASSAASQAAQSSPVTTAAAAPTPSASPSASPALGHEHEPEDLPEVGRNRGVLRSKTKTLPSLVNQRHGPDHSVDTSALEVLDWVREVLKKAQTAATVAGARAAELAAQALAAATTSTPSSSPSKRRKSSASATAAATRAANKEIESALWLGEASAKYVHVENLEEDFGDGLELLVLIIGELLGAAWVPQDVDLAEIPSTGAFIAGSSSAAFGDFGDATGSPGVNLEPSVSFASPARRGTEVKIQSPRGSTPGGPERSLAASPNSRSSMRSPRRSHSSNRLKSVISGSEASPTRTMQQLDWIEIVAQSSMSPEGETLRSVAHILVQAAVDELGCHVPEVVSQQLHLCRPSVKLMFLTAIFNRLHFTGPAAGGRASSVMPLDASALGMSMTFGSLGGDTGAGSVAASAPPAPVAIGSGNGVPSASFPSRRVLNLFGKAAAVDAAKGTVNGTWAAGYGVFLRYALLSSCNTDIFRAAQAAGHQAGGGSRKRGGDFSKDSPKVEGLQWDTTALSTFVADCVTSILAGSRDSTRSPSRASTADASRAAPSANSGVVSRQSMPFVRHFLSQAFRAFVQTAVMSDDQVREDMRDARTATGYDRWLIPAGALDIDGSAGTSTKLEHWLNSRLVKRVPVAASVTPPEPVITVTNSAALVGNSSTSSPALSPKNGNIRRSDTAAFVTPLNLSGKPEEQSSLVAENSEVTPPSAALEPPPISQIHRLTITHDKLPEFYVRLGVLLDLPRWAPAATFNGLPEGGPVNPEVQGTGVAVLGRWYEANLDNLKAFVRLLVSHFAGGYVSLTGLTSASPSSPSSRKASVAPSLAGSIGNVQPTPSSLRQMNPTNPAVFGLTAVDAADGRGRLLSQPIMNLLRTEFWTAAVLAPLFVRFSQVPPSRGGVPSNWKLLEQRRMSFFGLLAALEAVSLTEEAIVDAHARGSSDDLSTNIGVVEFLINASFEAVSALESVKGGGGGGGAGGRSPRQGPAKPASKAKSVLTAPGSATFLRALPEEVLLRLFFMVAAGRVTSAKLHAKAASPQAALIVPSVKFAAKTHSRLFHPEGDVPQLPNIAMIPPGATITYSGFCELLVAISDTMVACPWLSLLDRLRMVLEHCRTQL